MNRCSQPAGIGPLPLVVVAPGVGMTPAFAPEATADVPEAPTAGALVSRRSSASVRALCLWRASEVSEAWLAVLAATDAVGLKKDARAWVVSAAGDPAETHTGRKLRRKRTGSMWSYECCGRRLHKRTGRECHSSARRIPRSAKDHARVSPCVKPCQGQHAQYWRPRWSIRRSQLPGSGPCWSL